MRDEEALPEGWHRRSLGSDVLVDVQPGFACGSHNRSAEGVPHLRPMNVTAEGQISLADLKRVPESEVWKDERWLRRGDVIFNNTNSPALVGKTAYYGEREPRAFSNHMTRLRVDEAVLDPRYLSMTLHQLWREGYFESRCNNHVSQASISRAVLLETDIPLPPLKEQQRIVERTERLLRSVTQGREGLLATESNLRRLRQSVLAAACAGRLTVDWRHDRGESDDWPMVALESVADGFSYGSAAKSSPAGRVPVLRMGNIQSGRLDWTDLVYTSDAKEIAKYRLAPGDVLFNRTNSPELVGKTAVYRGERDAIYAGYLIRVRCSPKLLPDFLNYSLNGPAGRAYLASVRTDGVSQSNINARSLAAFEFGLPSIAEQHEIVNRVEAFFALADTIEKRVAAASARADKLTQAILAKAFRGELVPTEAELNRRREAVAATRPPTPRPTAARPAPRRSR